MEHTCLIEKIKMKKNLKEIAVIAHEEEYTIEDVVNILEYYGVQLTDGEIEEIIIRKKEIEKLPKPVMGE